MARLGPSPPASSQFIHRVMLSNRAKDTRLEVSLRQAISSKGVKGFRVNYRIGGTRTDIAFPAKKVAVFVHGCFWHHCPKCDLPTPKTHRTYWAKKFELNRVRDRRVRISLRRQGWNVIELWEHQIKENLNECTRIIEIALGQSHRSEVSRLQPFSALADRVRP
jgi:DNA mismatch endonuclease (patch repair protein)